MRTQPTTQKSPQGFTVLFAVLVASLLLAVGFSIFDITFKEATFATVVRNSNFAIYAADSGLECALYWDSKYQGGSVFATSSGSQPPQSGITCAGTDIAAQAVAAHTWPIAASGNSATSTFTFSLPGRSYCAIVQVQKTVGSGTISTAILSRGYNTCSTSDPNRVERALQATY